MVTCREGSVSAGTRHDLYPKGVGLQQPQFFGTSYIRQHGMTYRASKQILHKLVIIYDDRKIFTGLTTHPAWPKFFVTLMVTRNMFAVANLLGFNFVQITEEKQ